MNGKIKLSANLKTTPPNELCNRLATVYKKLETALIQANKIEQNGFVKIAEISDYPLLKMFAFKFYFGKKRYESGEGLFFYGKDEGINLDFVAFGK